MRPSYSIDDLNIDIKLLELRQRQELQEFKDQIQLTKESLKPGRLIKNALGGIKIDSHEKKDIFSTILSIGAGYLSSKILVGQPQSTFKRFLGSMVQLAVANFVTKKTSPEA